VRWHVKVVVDGRKYKFWIRKGCMYFSPKGFTPSCQTSKCTNFNKERMTLDARTSKFLYTLGESVEVDLSIQSSNSSSTKKIKQTKIKLVQKVQTSEWCYRSIVDDLATASGAKLDNGCWSKTFKLTPRMSRLKGEQHHDLRCAHVPETFVQQGLIGTRFTSALESNLPLSRQEEPLAVSPTFHFKNAMGQTLVSVTYEVHVSVIMAHGPTLKLTAPLVIGDEALNMQPEFMKLITPASTCSLPSYQKYSKKSKVVQQTIRRSFTLPPYSDLMVAPSV